MRPFIVTHAADQLKAALNELPEHELERVTGGAAADFTYGFIISGAGGEKDTVIQDVNENADQVG